MAANPRTAAPHLDEANIPPEMLEAPRWVCWRYETREGKPTKVPINPFTGRRASATDPETWASFRQARLRANADTLAGVGFMLGDGFVGVDVDDCRDAETGEVEPWAQQIVDEVSSYTEVTPSGTGLHIIAYGVVPIPDGKQGGRKKYETGEVEIYADWHFFTVTGQHLDGTATTIEQRDSQLADLWRRIFPASDAPTPRRRNVTADLPDDDALIAEMMAAANGAKFARLWNGDASEYGGNESSADFALVQMLAFWTQDDASTIDRLFRRSGLMREKWDSRRGSSTYGEQTIENALKQPHETRRPRMLHDDRPQRKQHEEREEAATLADGLHATDMGNAERLVERHSDDLRYMTKRDRWLVWDTRVWTEDYSDHALSFAKQTARAIYQEAADAQDDVAKKELAKHAIRSASERSLRAMLSLSRHDLRIAPEDLDSDPWALNVENGTIDLRTGRLRPHNRRDYLTKLAPVTFDPSATAPTFDAFIHRIMGGNERLVAFLQRAFGYSLTGDISEQVFFLGLGTGANGKSTLLGTFVRVLGSYATHSRAETFMVKKGEQIPQDVARLNGARFVSTVETEDGQRLAESLIKSLTGSDPMTARFMRENEFTFRPVLKLWMATNHEPKIRGTDHAIWRRVLRIPFAVQIPDSEKDKRLEAKLYAERAGILNWALAGCLAWQRDGLQPPCEVTQATADYQSRMDVLGQFVEELCVEGKDYRVPLNHAYEKYKAWCADNNEYAVKKLEFSQRITERDGITKRPGTGNVTTLFGVGIRASQVEDAS